MEGFLRSERSLTQTAGRAARNINSKVILYADKTTDSMARMIKETNRRREKQMTYNIANDITPTQIFKTTEDIMGQTAVASAGVKIPHAYYENEKIDIAADPVIQYMPQEKLRKLLAKTRKSMEIAVKDLDFLEAARLRDELFALEKLLESK
jgi:excinuclease ABC subunit B